MASKTTKHKKKPACQCEQRIDELLDLARETKKRQDILMDGHAHLSSNIKGLSLWALIINCFRSKR